MWIEAVSRMIRYHLTNGRTIVLTPGEPVDLAEEQARHLLSQAPTEVRQVPRSPVPEPVQVELGPDRPVWWKSADGTIRRGLAVLLGKVETDDRVTCWVGIQNEDGRVAWVRDDRLRAPGAVTVPAASAQATCARCGGPPPLTWRQGWLVCPRCRSGVASDGPAKTPCGGF